MAIPVSSSVTAFVVGEAESFAAGLGEFGATKVYATGDLQGKLPGVAGAAAMKAVVDGGDSPDIILFPQNYEGRDIVARLSTGDATVGELAAPYEVSVQAVSKHLKVLEDAGLVTRSRDAQRRPVHLQPEVFDLMRKWIERYQRQVEERYQRLDAVLADLEEPPASEEEAAS